MNNALSPVFNQLLSTLVWVIPLMLVVSVLRSPWGKGHVGEWFVHFMLLLRRDRQRISRCTTSPWPHPMAARKSTM